MSDKKRASQLGKVGVLLGGQSGEREISLRSGSGVLAALLSRGVNAHPFDPGERSLVELAEEKFDRVFIALHGPYGEDGTMQGVLEQLGIPYTGSGVMASALAMDKVMTKRIWLSKNLPTPRYIELSRQSDWNAVIAELGLPLIVKPAHEGSTLGISRVTTADALPAAYALAAQYDKSVLAEEFIAGMELTCPVLDMDGEPRALPLVRIIAPDANYDYENKYFSGKTQYLCPCGLDENLEKEIQAVTVEAYKMLGCRGWGRADIMLRASDEKPYLLEMNTSPGMTDQSLVPRSARAAGIDYEELCMRILEAATLDREKTKW
ncbi:D-alanine--D-alanine ligase [Oxalobacter vibrioformis]|uniref:D-alanine--D-alanine ligase n=1 Tax=Oxalobacter vibrioformis TaxID=933080 RepID=A0A9E9M0W5_9BURK|nr:D-alanine--D-alanine ligase [Oxalobacter vibrioformis]WAW11122.1 D-alanine--D-alanine ligase [Oxalobacter vibrioformis]